MTMTGEKIKGGMKNIKPYEASGFQLITINTECKMKSESRLSTFSLYEKPLQLLVDYLHFIEEL